MTPEHVYHCRFCGGPLPANFKGLYHPPCRAADKRIRVQRERERQEAELLRRLARRAEWPRAASRHTQEAPPAAK